jgi:hypothetical protein
LVRRCRHSDKRRYGRSRPRRHLRPRGLDHRLQERTPRVLPAGRSSAARTWSTDANRAAKLRSYQGGTGPPERAAMRLQEPGFAGRTVLHGRHSRSEAALLQDDAALHGRHSL